MIYRLLIASLALSACTARSCDDDHLRAGFADGGAAGVGASGGAGASVATGAAGGMGASGGASTCRTLGYDSDLTNCGREGEVCGEFSFGCVQGNCIIYQGDATPSGLAINGPDLYYWLTAGSDSGLLFRQSLDSTTAQQSTGIINPLTMEDIVAWRFVNGFFFVTLTDASIHKIGEGLMPGGWGSVGGFMRSDLYVTTAAGAAWWVAANGSIISHPVLGPSLIYDTPPSTPAAVAVRNGQAYFFDEVGDVYKLDGAFPMGTPTRIATGFPMPSLMVNMLVPADDPYAFVIVDDGIYRGLADDTVDNAELVAAVPDFFAGDIIKAQNDIYFTSAPVNNPMHQGALFRVAADATNTEAEVLYRTINDGPVGYLDASSTHIFVTVPADNLILRRHINAMACAE